jgi:hypothetical protein
MVGLSPGLGSVSGYPWPLERVRDRVVLGGGMFPLVRFVRCDTSVGWGPRSSDDVCHILVWDTSRTLFPCGGRRI